MRFEPEIFATVASLKTSTSVPQDNDLISFKDLRCVAMWIAGATDTVDDVSVFEQTSQLANGRFIRISPVLTKKTGTLSVPALGNGQGQIFTATVAGIPIGTNVNAVITNSPTAYTAGAAIPTELVIQGLTVSAANTITFLAQNFTGSATDGFTAAISVTLT